MAGFKAGLLGFRYIVWNDGQYLKRHDLQSIICTFALSLVVAKVSFACGENAIPFEKVPGGLWGCLGIAAVLSALSKIVYDLLYSKYEKLHYGDLCNWAEKVKKGEIIVKKQLQTDII